MRSGYLNRREAKPGKIQDRSAQELKAKLEELSLRVHDAEERMGIVVLPQHQKPAST